MFLGLSCLNLNLNFTKSSVCCFYIYHDFLLNDVEFVNFFINKSKLKQYCF